MSEYRPLERCFRHDGTRGLEGLAEFRGEDARRHGDGDPRGSVRSCVGVLDPLNRVGDTSARAVGTAA